MLNNLQTSFQNVSNSGYHKFNQEFEAPDCIAAVSKAKQVVLNLRYCPKNQERASQAQKSSFAFKMKSSVLKTTVLKYEMVQI